MTALNKGIEALVAMNAFIEKWAPLAQQSAFTQELMDLTGLFQDAGKELSPKPQRVVRRANLMNYSEAMENLF